MDRVAVDRVAVDRVLVVVPARDESAELVGCLRALRGSVASLPPAVAVHVVVVADACTDDTAGLAAACGAQVVVVDAGCVGAARRAGVSRGLRAAGWTASPGTWIATTDADSRVPRSWLGHHVRAGAAGADLLLGTVRLAGPPWRHAAWRVRYAAGTRGGRGHRHVHGANLGVRASAYVAAGGFPALPGHEDRRFADAVRALPGARVLSSAASPVLTSDRLLGRAPLGVAHDLRTARAVRAVDGTCLP